MKKNIKQFLIIVAIVVMLILPYFVFATSETPPLNALKSVGEGVGYQAVNQSSISQIAGVVVRAFLSLLGVIFIILMLYAGYSWMTAAGEEAKVTKAKDSIRRAIIGLIIVVGSYAIWNFVFYNFLFK